MEQEAIQQQQPQQQQGEHPRKPYLQHQKFDGALHSDYAVPTTAPQACGSTPTNLRPFLSFCDASHTGSG